MADEKKVEKAVKKDLIDAIETLQEKNFFHRINGRSDNWFIQLSNDTLAIIPINSKCGVQIVKKENLKAEIKEFYKELDAEKDRFMKDYNERYEAIKKYEKEL